MKITVNVRGADTGALERLAAAANRKLSPALKRLAARRPKPRAPVGKNAPTSALGGVRSGSSATTPATFVSSPDTGPDDSSADASTASEDAPPIDGSIDPELL